MEQHVDMEVVSRNSAYLISHHFHKLQVLHYNIEMKTSVKEKVIFPRAYVMYIIYEDKVKIQANAIKPGNTLQILKNLRS